MSEQAKKQLVPKLRFKEFSEKWEVKILDDCVQVMQSGISRLLNDSDVGIPVIRSNNLVEENLDISELKYCYEIDNQGANLENYFLSDGDLLVNFINSQAQIGKVALYKNLLKRNVIFTTNLLRLTFNHSVNHQFIFYFFQTKEYTRYIQEIAKPAVNQSSFTTKEFKRLIVPIPNLEEQTKIAACLSSLDDLITAQTQKIEALKTHKKGLMQQLFPQEGETIPKLRFLEFLDSGEWGMKTLLDLCLKGFSNGVFNDPAKVGSGYKLINVLDMYIDTAINENNLNLLELSKAEFEKNKVEYGDIFFTRSSLVKEGIAYSNVYLGNSEDVTFDGHLIRMRPKKEFNSIFLNYILKTSKVRSQLVARGKTATMTTIGQADIATVNIQIPILPEQIKIADCLSSLDELINAQVKKLDALKLHKKGLMQGLFPSLNEEDYTKSRQNLDTSETIEDISKKAMALRDKG